MEGVRRQHAAAVYDLTVGPQAGGEPRPAPEHRSLGCEGARLILSGDAPHGEARDHGPSAVGGASLEAAGMTVASHLDVRCFTRRRIEDR